MADFLKKAELASGDSRLFLREVSLRRESCSSTKKSYLGHLYGPRGEVQNRVVR
jgi:hypothetical protein